MAQSRMARGRSRVGRAASAFGEGSAWPSSAWPPFHSEGDVSGGNGNSTACPGDQPVGQLPSDVHGHGPTTPRGAFGGRAENSSSALADTRSEKLTLSRAVGNVVDHPQNGRGRPGTRDELSVAHRIVADGQLQPSHEDQPAAVRAAAVEPEAQSAQSDSPEPAKTVSPASLATGGQ
jgi:hypothetical protein